MLHCRSVTFLFSVRKLNTVGQLHAANVPTLCLGDVRVIENIALTSVHALFLREHNRLARTLHVLNPSWSSETLYQEARKIMGAYQQVKKISTPSFHCAIDVLYQTLRNLSALGVGDSRLPAPHCGP